MQITYPKIQNMTKNSTRSWNFELKIPNSAKNVGLLRNPIPYHILTTDNIDNTPPHRNTHIRCHVTTSSLYLWWKYQITLCTHNSPVATSDQITSTLWKILCSVYVRWPKWKEIIIGAETKWKHWVLGVLTSLTYRKLRYNFQNLD